MKLYITGDHQAQPYLACLKENLNAQPNTFDIEWIDPEEALDPINRYHCLALKTAADPESFGVIIEEFGMASFMIATKTKGLIATTVSDERTAYMSRQHNNAHLITIGPELVSIPQAMRIIKSFLAADYDGGRHQIRVDMLNALC